MEQDRNKRYAENLESVIIKNQQYLESVIDDFQSSCLAAAGMRLIPAGLLADIRERYRKMLSRLREIQAIRQLLRAKYRAYLHRNANQDKQIADIHRQIKSYYAKVERNIPSSAAQPSNQQIRPPAEQWLKTIDSSVAFTKNIRLLDDLEYASTAPPAVASGVELCAEKASRRSQQAGRSFTLFSARGPAPAMDAFVPSIRLWDHDIMERFSATEVRGVLTHLCPVTSDTITLIFARLLADQFRDVKCIIITIGSPDDIHEGLFGKLEQAAAELSPGRIRIIALPA